MQNILDRNTVFNFSSMMIFILMFVFSTLSLEAKSVLPAKISESIVPDMIHVDPEPVITSSIQPAQQATQINLQQNQISWDSITNLSLADNQFCNIQLKPGEVSNRLIADGFKFRIPQGSAIQQIRIHMLGKMEGSAKPAVINFGLTDKNLVGIGTDFYHKSGQGNSWPANGSSGSWFYTPNQSDWISGLSPDSVNTNTLKINFTLMNTGTGDLLVSIDQISLEIIYLPLYTLMKGQIGKSFLNISFIDSLASKYTYNWDLPEGGSLYNEFRFGSMITFAMEGDSFGVKQICVNIHDPDGTVITLCRNFLYVPQPPTTVNVFVWHDMNANGLQDESEPGIPDQTIEIFESTGAKVQSVVSAETGDCLFNLTKGGKYFLKWISDEQFMPTILITGGDSTLNNDFYTEGSIYRTQTFSLKKFEQIIHHGLGLIKPAKISGQLWHDLNGNNQKDPDDPVLTSQVTLYENGTIVNQQIPDETGKFEFSKLSPGNYICCFERPVGSILPSNSTWIAGNAGSDLLTCSKTIQLSQEQHAENSGTGILFYGQSEGKAWLDTNENGIMEPEEPAIPGIGVSLLDSSVPDAVSESLTDENGRFEFKNIYPGTYKLEIKVQENYNVTNPMISSDHTVNSWFYKSDSSYFTEAFLISSGTEKPFLNAGFIYKKAGISGQVWLDENRNGMPDETENGFNGITIHLLNIENQLVQSVLTTDDQNGEKGFYQFTDILPGSYFLKFEMTDLYIPTLSIHDLGGSVSVITDQNGPYTSDVFELLPGENLEQMHAGLSWNYAKVNGRIWGDNNENGIQDIGERGISGVLLQLINQENEMVAQVYSGDGMHAELGTYSFENIIPSTCFIQMIPGDAAYIPTLYQAGNQPDSDSDFDKEDLNIRTDWLTLSPGSVFYHVDGGLITKDNSIGGQVWHDENYDGLKNDPDLFISGVEVLLFRENGDEIARTNTDIEGKYLFKELSIGHYYLQFQPGDSWVFTVSNPTPVGLNSDVSHAFGTGTTPLIELVHETYMTDIDAGLTPNFSEIQSYIWVDDNGNGLQDADESGVGEILVRLFDAENTPISEKISQNSGSEIGRCLFEQVIPGTYYLVYELPSRYKPTVHIPGLQDLNSDIFMENSVIRTPEFNLAGGSTLSELDAGLQIRYATIGDFVWLDSNRNGRQDDEESGMNDIPVFLMNSSGEAVGITVSGTNDQTGRSGFYRFEQILPGNYYIKVDIPGINEITGHYNVYSDLNSKLTGNLGVGTTDLFTVNYGDSIYFMDLGLVVKPASVGNFVWLDANRNGLQDPGEAGLNGVAIALLDNDGNTIHTTQSKYHPSTGQNGFYRFEFIEPGDYKLSIRVPVLMQLSPKNSGDPGVDSDADVDNSLTDVLNLEPGQSNEDIDFGLSFKTSSIGDFIWLDLNENGIQDTLEQGLDSILVHLFDEAGVLVYSTESHYDTVIQKNGQYHFKEVESGSYVIKIDIPAGYLPSNYVSGDPAINSDFTHQNGFGTTDFLEIDAGSARTDIDFGLIKVHAQLGDRVWLDVNKNGIQEINETGINGIQIRLFNETGNWIKTTWTTNHPMTGEPGYWSFYNLPVGFYYVRFVIPVEYSNSKAFQGNNATLDSDITHKYGPGTTDLVFLPDSYTQLDIDAGLYLETYSSIGDLVWEDLNGNEIQDKDEPGINDVTIILYNEQGVRLRQTKTKSLDGQKPGHFLFDYLPNGKYYLKIIVPTGYYVTTPYSGNDPSKDSDITHLNGPYTTSTITLGVKQDQTTVDFGLFRLGSIDGLVWQDLDGNGLINEAEPGVNQVLVELFDHESNLISSALSEKDPETTGDGDFKFDFLDPGFYYLRFTPGSGVDFTCFNAGDDMLDSDVTNGNGQGTTSLFLLQSGQKLITQSAGLSSAGGRLSGIVWLDTNGDGAMQPEENGINNFRVALMQSDGTVFSFVETYSHAEQEGYFAFFSIPPGNYYLAFESREDYAFSDPSTQTGQPVSIISNLFGHGTSDLFAISPGQNLTDLLCGVYKPAKFSGYVWYDTNSNGIKNDEEQVVEGVSVSLSRNIYETVDQTLTNSEGYYAFDGLIQGVYQVQVTPPTGYGFTNPGQGADRTLDSDMSSDGRSPLITVIHGAEIEHINAGLVAVSNLISGFVVSDPEGVEGQKTGIGGISFYLQDGSGTNLHHARSDSKGYYRFYNLPPGKYRVKAVFDKNRVVKTAKNVGSSNLFDDKGYSNWLFIRENSILEDLDLVLLHPTAPEDIKLLRVLPNPAQKTARLETNIEGKIIDRIIIFDLAGNMLIDEMVDFNQSEFIELDISFLPGGMYRVYAFVGGKAVNQKFLYKADP